MFTIESPSVGLIVCDVATREGHGYSNTITGDPVEKGGEVTDHIYPDPFSLAVDLVISDSPIGSLAKEGRAGRAAEAHAKLELVHGAREALILGTSLRRWVDMALERFDVDQDRTTGQALYFSATFRQISIAESVRAATRVSIPLAAGETNRGSVPSPEVPAVDAISGATFAPPDPTRQLPQALTGPSQLADRQRYLASHPNGVLTPIGPF